MSGARNPLGHTSFASAARADGPKLEAQRQAFMADPVAAALLEAMPGPAMVLNPNRQVVAVNALLRDTFGTDRTEQFFGLRPGEMLHCVHADEQSGGCGTTRSCAHCGTVRTVLECIVTRRRVVCDARLRTLATRDGGSLDVRVHASPVVVSDEFFVVVGIEDVGSEKRREVLEHLFFRDLSGTLGEVNGIAGRLDVPQPDPQRDAADRHDLHLLADLALEQIAAQRQLLAAERGDLAIEPHEVDLAGLLHKVADRCRGEALAHGRTIVLEHGRMCALRTDPVVLARAAGELLRNALEASPEGGTVSLSCQVERHAATLSVHNDGLIPEGVQLQIFQRSFSTREGEGRGIGTYGVKLLVERYLGGQVAFVSDERVGTLFVIILPDWAMTRRAAA